MSSRVKAFHVATRGRWSWLGVLGCLALACSEPEAKDNVSTGVVEEQDRSSNDVDSGKSSTRTDSPQRGAETTSEAENDDSVSPAPTLVPPSATPIVSTVPPPMLTAPASSEPPMPPLVSAPAAELDAGSPPDVDPPSLPQPESDSGSPGTDETSDGNAWGLDRMDDPIENPVECPVEEPNPEDSCIAGVVCKYGSEPDCRSRWMCDSNGAWWLEYGMRDCPGVCPDQEPTEGATCDRHSMQCSYGEDPSCRSNWLCYEAEWWILSPGGECDDNACPDEPPQSGLTCDPQVDSYLGCRYAFGEACSCFCGWDGDTPLVQWYCGTTSALYPPEYLTACPPEQPEEGTPCDTGSTCGYVTLEECTAPGAGTTLANCVDGQWALTLPSPP